MKRQMGGGAYRGPAGLQRQRRTIRFVQLLMVLAAAGLLMFAGYSVGRSSGLDAAATANELDQPNDPSVAQVWVPAVIGVGLFLGALGLQGSGVRLLTPRRLRELDAEGPQPIGPIPEEEDAD